MAEETENAANDLISFDWGATEDNDFFQMEDTKPTPKAAVKKEIEEEEEIKPTPKHKKKEEEEEEELPIKEDAFFSEEEDEEDEEGKPTSTNSGDDKYWEDLYKEYKDLGLLNNVELEEGEVLSEEKLLELREQEYETEVGARLKDWAQKDLDEDAQAFIKFKTTGGSTADFFAAYAKSSEAPTGNIEDDDVQDRVIRFQLKGEGWDSDEIEDRLDYLTKSGRKEKVAKKYNLRIEAADKASKASILEAAKERKIAQEKSEQEYRNDIQETLTSTKEVNGFSITPKDRTNLFNLLTKRDQKTEDGKPITGFQKKLAGVFQDKEKMILLAKLVNSDFDMSGFKKATITKKTKQVKRNLEQRRSLRPSGSGGSHQGSSLAELF